MDGVGADLADVVEISSFHKDPRALPGVLATCTRSPRPRSSAEQFGMLRQFDPGAADVQFEHSLGGGVVAVALRLD